MFYFIIVIIVVNYIITIIIITTTTVLYSFIGFNFPLQNMHEPKMWLWESIAELLLMSVSYCDIFFSIYQEISISI